MPIAMPLAASHGCMAHRTVPAVRDSSIYFPAGMSHTLLVVYLLKEYTRSEKTHASRGSELSAGDVEQRACHQAGHIKCLSH